MKTKIAFYSLVLALGLFSTACKKEEVIPPIDDTPTVAENKQTIENTGIDLVNSMTELKDLQAMKSVSSFSSYMNKNTPKNGKHSVVKNNLGIEILNNLTLLSKEKMSLTDFFSSMKGYTEKSIKADSTALQFKFDQVKGVYTWNPSITDWDYVATGNDIVFNFPSTETGTTNNASITITYTGIDVNLPFGAEDQYTGDLPSEVTMNLKVDGTSQLSYSLECTYNSNGIPSSVVSTLTVSPFSLVVSVNYSTTDVSVLYSFKKNTQIILEFGAGVTGDFVITTVDDAINDTTADFNTAGNIVHNANAHFQIFNIKLDGTLNTKELAKTLNTIKDNVDNGTIEDSIATQQAITAVNTNLVLKLLNTSTNDEIAKLKAYTFSGTNTYTTWEYNPATGMYEEVIKTESSTEVGMKFFFPDGTSVDADVYFNDGFGDLVSQINTFIADLNTEYALGITPIDYTGTK